MPETVHIVELAVPRAAPSGGCPCPRERAGHEQGRPRVPWPVQVCGRLLLLRLCHLRHAQGH